MEHPFINDLADKKLEDLQLKISELNTKLSFAYRTGNRPLIMQLQMAIESYRNAYTKKMDEVMQKQKMTGKINIQKDK